MKIFHCASPALTSATQSFRQTLVEQCLPLSRFLNGMARSPGQGDVHPCVISPAVVDKLCFVHDMIVDVRTGGSIGRRSAPRAASNAGARSLLLFVAPAGQQTAAFLQELLVRPGGED